jgi:hypothetical protein
MIGYKCNYCGDEILEKEYLYLKDKGSLTCQKCGKGKYEAYFKDKEEKKNFDYRFTEDFNQKKPGWEKEEEERGNNFTGKVKSLIRKGNELPGATAGNRVIGTITGAIVGSILLGGIPIIGLIGIIAGGIAGFSFAPYFVPWMRRGFKKLVSWIKRKIDDDSDESKK